MPGPIDPSHRGGCWTCTFFDRRWERSDVLCMQGQLPHIHANPDGGCAFWIREADADDELQFDRPPQAVEVSSSQPIVCESAKPSSQSV